MQATDSRRSRRSRSHSSECKERRKQQYDDYILVTRSDRPAASITGCPAADGIRILIEDSDDAPHTVALGNDLDGDGKAYFFKGNVYDRVDIDDGYPANIVGSWPGVLF